MSRPCRSRESKWRHPQNLRLIQRSTLMIFRKMRTVVIDKCFLAVAAALYFIGECAITTRAAELPVTSPWTKEIVNIEVARKQYDYYQPWSRRTHRTQKTGLIISDHEILTTADELFDRTLIRL